MQKKRVIGIIASPRKNGNTAFLTEKLLSNLEESFNIEKIYLKDYEIKPCEECYHCVENDECSIKDDMSGFYNKLRDAHVIILASPIFMGGVTSRMKAFMERTWHLRKGQLKDKIGSFIIVGRRDIGSGANEMEEYLSRLKLNKLAGVLGFGLKEVTVSIDREALENIERLSTQIISLNEME